MSDDDISSDQSDLDEGFSIALNNAEISTAGHDSPDEEETSGQKRSGVQDDSAGKTPKKKRKLKNDNELKKLHKPPTVEELNRLRETENLFHSHLFRLHIEEMLKTMEVKSKDKIRINSWFDKLKEWILKIEEGGKGYDLSDIDWLKTNKVKLPLSQFNVRVKGHYHFRPPTQVQIIGSYLTKTMVAMDKIDIAVEMPSRFFDKEDFSNGRYYRKRAIYLCELAKHLQTMPELVEEVKFASNEGDDWRPILEVTPAGKLAKKNKFFIHLVCQKGSFKSNRFIPTRNNVRSRWFFGDDSNLIDDQLPTTEYNSGILRDLRALENEEFLSELLLKNGEMCNAVMLLKVWARQRELHLGHGGLNGHFLSFLVAYLSHIKKIHAAMSSYQIVRTVWNYLTTADWTQSGITLCDDSSGQLPSISDFHNNFPLVFVDPSGFLNLCAGMSASMFLRCKDEAVLALRYLDMPDVNSFLILFLTPAPFTRLCDHYIVIRNPNALEKLSAEFSSESKKIDFCGQTYPQACHLVVNILQRGLGDRVRRLCVQQPPTKTWATNKKPRPTSPIIVGLLLDPQNCFNLVDKGPVADAKEAEEFREFWKNKSELRRFKDGTITESVLWDAKTWQQKRMICRQVTKYLFEEKFGLKTSDYHYCGDEIEVVLPKDRETNMWDVTVTYEKLVKSLRGLKDLPLDVISVQGTSPVFRSTEIFPLALPATKSSKKKGDELTLHRCALVDPKSHFASAWCAPAEVVIQLGSSNKWPRDLSAVRRIRAAFNLKISQLLTEQCGYVTQPDQDAVAVLTETCVFLLKIVYPGEVALIKKTSTPDGLVMYRDTEESIRLEKTAQHLPKLTSALSGLQSQHSSYGPACCLAKRWVRSHLFHPTHISDEAIDLLMASVFINLSAWEPPNQPQLAFIRFLSLLETTSWNSDFILLNINQVLTVEDKSAITNFFRDRRATLPAMFIATPEDRTSSVWTKDGPSPVVLQRLIDLAHHTLRILENQFFETSCPDVLPVFQPSFHVFDVIINLVMAFVPKSSQALSAMKTTATENHGKENMEIIPVIGFDPVEKYIEELKESYGEWSLFFYDPYGGSTIGVLWKPTRDQIRDFKVSHLYGRHWDKTNNTLIFDTDAILQGFHVLGAGLVKSVQVKKEGEFTTVNF